MPYADKDRRKAYLRLYSLTYKRKPLNKAQRKRASERSRQWYKNNRDLTLERARKGYAENREQCKANRASWYQMNKRQVIKAAKSWQRENTERKREISRKYARKALAIRQEIIRARDRKWKSEHPWYALYFLHIRTAMMRRAKIGDRKKLLAFFKRMKSAKRLRCTYCKYLVPPEQRTADHAIPITRGGEHSVNNLVHCCKRCNSSKGNKTPEEFRLYLRLLARELRQVRG